MKSRSIAFFNEAAKRLKLAKEELFKPEEDIVSYSVCKNSQFAIENFLKGFLLKNDGAIEADDTIESMYQRCIAIDKDFKLIDLNAIGCKNHAIDSRYCSEVNSVSACYDTADNIDTFLKKSKII